MASTPNRLLRHSQIVSVALSFLFTASLCLSGCESAPASGNAGPSSSPFDPAAIRALEPRPGSGGVALIPTFAWAIPGKKNRVATQIFNLYRADAVNGDADFIRVFDGPIERFQLNEGQEDMPALGLGRLSPNTEYVWKISLFFSDTSEVHTGEWHFKTGAE